MIETMPRNNHTFLKILCIAGAIYAFYNKDKISHGINDYLAKNQTLQEVKSSLKWAYDEFGPKTEAEKTQEKAYAESQRKLANEYRAMGVDPYPIKYVSPKDKEWGEAVKGLQELKKMLGR